MQISKYCTKIKLLMFPSCNRTFVSWDTDISLLVGKELSVELKTPSVPFLNATPITHNFVSTSLVQLYTMIFLPVLKYSGLPAKPIL